MQSENANIRDQRWLSTMSEALWLTGERKAAISVFANIDEISPDQKISLLAMEAIQHDNWLPLIRMVKDGRTAPFALPAAYLWVYALKSSQISSSLPRLSQLRRTHSVSSLSSFDGGKSLEAAIALEQAYDNTTPLLHRLNILGKALENRHLLPSLTQELLLLLAVARHTKRYSQASLFEMTIGLYRNQCQALNPAQSNSINSLDGKFDPLGIGIDLFKTNIANKANSTFKTSGISRFLKFSNFAVKNTGKIAAARLMQMVRNDATAQQNLERVRFEIGQDALNVLGELKGGFMKLGQILSYAADASPQTELGIECIQHSAVSTDPAESFRIVEEDLGTSVNELFSEWNPEPVAVGSIGQVFHAKTHEGIEVAVKVQHSKIGAALESDLRAMGILRPVIRHLLPSANHDGIISEVRQQLQNETNYQREAANQIYFANEFMNDAKIRIPKILPQLSSQRVITMEFVRGRTFSEFIAEASQSERNEAATTVLRMFAVSFSKLNKFNADPHPGNYLFHEDGCISFIDFGCVKEFTPNFVINNIKGVESILLQDRIENRKSWEDLGYTSSPNTFDFAEMFKVFTQTYELMMKDEPFKFNKPALNRVHKAQLNTKIRSQISPPPESAMFIRYTWGLWSLMAQLEPELNFNELIKNGLRKFHEIDRDDKNRSAPENTRTA